MSEWKPIRTAPRDVPVLLFSPRRFYAVGWWDWDLEEWAISREGVIRDVTHWHPLPHPPSEYSFKAGG